MNAATHTLDLDDLPGHTGSPLSPPVVNLATVVQLRQDPPLLPSATLSRVVEPNNEPLVDDSDQPLYARRVTLLPKGWLFSGTIHTDDPFDVNCQIVGDVVVTSGRPCVLQVESQVEGTIAANNLNMHGTLKGKVNAVGGKVVIHRTAKVEGEMRYTDIAMLGGVHNMNLTYEGQPA